MCVADALWAATPVCNDQQPLVSELPSATPPYIPMSDYVSHAPFTKCHLPYSQLTDKMTLAPDARDVLRFSLASHSAIK